MGIINALGIGKVTQGHPGWFHLYSAQASFAFPARRSGPAALAQEISAIFGLYPSLASLLDSFLYLGKLHWFPYLELSCFYEPRVFIYRWSSNFLKKVALERERWWLRCHLVPPTLCSSRKYPYPSPHGGQRIFRGERAPKRRNFRGVGVAS